VAAFLIREVRSTWDADLISSIRVPASRLAVSASNVGSDTVNGRRIEPMKGNERRLCEPGDQFRDI
jgi:hypothetical protein